MAAVQASRDKGATTAVVAAAAMFVVLVTRTNDQWASWSEHDNMFVRYGSCYGICCCVQCPHASFCALFHSHIMPTLIKLLSQAGVTVTTGVTNLMLGSVLTFVLCFTVRAYTYMHDNSTALIAASDSCTALQPREHELKNWPMMKVNGTCDCF